ncbi:MAG: response regulator transcription factor [Phycisphaerae bacterium]|nr:response regulator transcription factor [Phycisphaerae bacterium]MDD5380983.1 response regulator transcription factor [Phycisphaerae bacterium]
MKDVLIIEDNLTMLRGLKDNFESKGYQVKTATDGELGLKAAMTGKPDLIILDIMLPKMNGYEVCSQIRKQNLDIPIIMLTAKDQEKDVVLGLNLGADDYVTKPFSIKVLMARAEALRRRKDKEPPVYKFGNCALDVIEGVFTRDGKKVKLTPEEFKLLHLFIRRSGETLMRGEILGAVWGQSHFITVRDVDNLVNALRDKIEPDPDDPTYIYTEEIVGYRFERPQTNGNDSDS